MSNTLCILNDVETNYNSDSLIGDNNAILSKEGENQCILVGTNMHKYINKLDVITSSDADYIKKLIHYVRIRSPYDHILKNTVQYTSSLRERSFGVLAGSRHSLNSSLFTHTRISAENGESISQCRTRLISYVTKFCLKNFNKNILLVSHPFSCQIISNCFLNKSHTVLTNFWLTKGSLMILKFKVKNSGVYGWKFLKACNVCNNQSYTEEEIYSRLSE